VLSQWGDVMKRLESRKKPSHNRHWPGEVNGRAGPRALAKW